jgi:hypothetical protein
MVYLFVKKFRGDRADETFHHECGKKPTIWKNTDTMRLGSSTTTHKKKKKAQLSSGKVQNLLTPKTS